MTAYTTLSCYRLLAHITSAREISREMLGGRRHLHPSLYAKKGLAPNNENGAHAA